ncbi:TetR/AcrR family transcriptional regulator [Pigmentiphaga sp.]|jgi:Transcriptional regulator|uniref:TetR/AcrR family transcriptional regulator n=1 Tax=Pigmentiphaga sp. TaxID=1977564 RepID=UPI0025EB846A|nr:TetR/AcrR family transcriptional regulator [Pigmentiphaga sp.]MBX6317441.1 TetR/AcrR family transcriptional regulator [Pigmentiphaga sp.]
MTTVINQGEPPRRRGRPLSFDRRRVLHQAMLTFWKLGYEGASVTDLTAAMGITPQSLYAAFGSKSALYREALEHYREHVGAFTIRALEEEPSAMAGFARMLTESANEFCKPKRPRGCMISMSALTCAEENRDEARHLAQLRNATIMAFQARINKAIEDGEFKAGLDSGGLARYLGAIVQGMSIQARDGATKQELLAIAALAIQALQQAAASPGGE